MDHHILYDRAKKKVKEKKEFYSNFSSWLAVSLFLFLINLLTSSEFLWAFFPFMGWGIGVFFHGLKVFSPRFNQDWEEIQIHQEMKRLNQRNQYEDDEYLDLDDLKHLRPRYKDSDFV